MIFFLVIFFFLSLSGRPLLLTHCRCIGLCSTWSHTVPHTHTVGLLWRRDQLVAELSISQNKTFTTDRHIFTLAEFKPAIPGSKRPRTARLPGWTLVTFVFIHCKCRSITCDSCTFKAKNTTDKPTLRTARNYFPLCFLTHFLTKDLAMKVDDVICYIRFILIQYFVRNCNFPYEVHRNKILNNTDPKDSSNRSRNKCSQDLFGSSEMKHADQ